MLVFAQVHVDPGAEVPTKYVIHEFERYLIGIVERRRELRSQNQTLTRAGTIEKIDGIFKDAVPGQLPQVGEIAPYQIAWGGAEGFRRFWRRFLRKPFE